MADELKLLLLDLIKKWAAFAADGQRAENAVSLSDYERGVAIGFEAAAEELRNLIHQLDNSVQPMPAPLPTPDVEIEVTPPAAINEPKWEYFYLSFDQAPDGAWRIKHMNGVWQPNWQEGISFDEAVNLLHEQGWKLARFASGIHVFKRPAQS